MKKIFLGLSVLFATLISAQNYPDYYPTNNDFSSYYGDAEDEYYFPDDYYYEYPSDYYTNDYRRSIEEVNWNRFFSKYRLSPWQIQQVIMLNEMFPSYNSWDFNYRYNPDRWYYDRYYALERILGPRIFISYQNNYYNGYNPVVYYQNYRRQHYVTNIYVVPRYRKIDVRRYHIDRTQYHQTNPRSNFGFRDEPRNGNGNWNTTPRTNGFRNNESLQNGSRNDGFRNNTQSPSINGQKPQGGGFRNDTGTRPETSTPRNNGFRNDTGARPETSTPRNNGFRNNENSSREDVPQRKIESNSSDRKSAAPRSDSPATSQRSSGLRFSSR